MCVCSAIYTVTEGVLIIPLKAPIHLPLYGLYFCFNFHLTLSTSLHRITNMSAQLLGLSKTEPNLANLVWFGPNFSEIRSVRTE